MALGEMPLRWTEEKLIAVALAIGARDVEGWSVLESRLCRGVPRVSSEVIDGVLKKIKNGGDPLGEVFCEVRTPVMRRKRGAIYTPKVIVKKMVRWAGGDHSPVRVIDPGVGSGRFLIEAGKRFKDASLIGVDVDPLAAILARAHLNAIGFSNRTRIVVGDYRDLTLPACEGQTLFIGNPPYVRHHEIETKWKEWLAVSAGKLGHSASQLAGLHVHFFLATALQAHEDDYGAFITSAEWLDVNYGSLARELFLGRLGGQSIVVVEPTAMPFPDVATTAAITTFRIGSKPSSVQLKRVDKVCDINGLDSGRRVRRERLEAEKRWSHFSRVAQEKRDGFVELGELCRVHRGQVTGANKMWIAGQHSEGLPQEVLFPTVTKARELFEAKRVLADASHLRRVIDLPVELDELDRIERKAVDAFLRKAKAAGVNNGYIAKYRRAWWSVGLRKPAPILATYMARRPPGFALNLAGARHLNIAHGLYPREPLKKNVIKTLVDFLSERIALREGRVYAGGLTKFEPREMERILVPSPEALEAGYA